MAGAGAGLRRAAGGRAVDARLGAVHRRLPVPRPPRPARDDRPVQPAAVAVVAGVLAGGRRLRGAELARRRADPWHAPVAATGGRCRWRASVMARAVPALRGGHAVAAGRRARLLVGLDRPRPPGLARPRQRDPAAT